MNAASVGNRQPRTPGYMGCNQLGLSCFNTLDKERLLQTNEEQRVTLAHTMPQHMCAHPIGRARDRMRVPNDAPSSHRNPNDQLVASRVRFVTSRRNPDNSDPDDNGGCDGAASLDGRRRPLPCPRGATLAVGNRHGGNANCAINWAGPATLATGQAGGDCGGVARASLASFGGDNGQNPKGGDGGDSGNAGATVNGGRRRRGRR